ncbi:hypothetical protein Ais01nite_19340 [Asanoa ishikariensis]|uniref:Uncharacterized protein n=1 Tax=Asanoa ishikariensis TaxID=137265 RepID=A0A1H3UBG5_9ACTN|nr:hypothetical protein [Asanoa ishikariensis]GIF63899.1 hypothetical protein Ais01nite_19340 [Asanoa ishikariensis]SDZ59813.1 hypothetical protein SAMN05421684_6940 [Asanoa ishikariensis]
MTSSPFAVPGVEPQAGSADQGSVGYRGDQFAGLPAVAAVLDGLPAELIALAGPAETREEYPIGRQALTEQVYVSTDDGLRWGLGFADEVGFLVQPSKGRIPEDLIEKALAEQPGVASVFHYDRESFEAETSELLRADEMMARWLAAIFTAHQAYASHLGRELPY